jgi:hypothetical protein
VDSSLTDNTTALQAWLSSGIANLTCSGTYNTDTLTISASVSISAPATGCVLAAKNGIATNHNILGITASDVSLSGVSFDQTNSSGTGNGVVVYSVSHVSLSNGFVLNPNHVGIYVSTSHAIRVENWKISGSAHAGAWGVESIDSSFNVFTNITGVGLPNRLFVSESDNFDTISNLGCYSSCGAEAFFLQDTSHSVVNNVVSDGTPSGTGDDEFVIYGASHYNTISNITVDSTYGVGVNLSASAAGAPTYNVLTNVTVSSPGENCLLIYDQGFSAPTYNQVNNLACYSPSQKAANTFNGIEFIGAQSNSVQGIIDADSAARYGILEADGTAASSSRNSFTGTVTAGSTGYALWSSSSSHMTLPAYSQTIQHYTTDANLSWDAASSPYTTIFEGALTADRTITLQSADAASGNCATVLNDSTGGHSVLVSNRGAYNISTLAASAGGSYQWDGANWYLVPSCH